MRPLEDPQFIIAMLALAIALTIIGINPDGCCR